MSNEHKYLLGSIFHSDCLKFLCYLKRDLGLSCKVLQILAREPKALQLGSSKVILLPM